MAEATISTIDAALARDLFGPHDRNLKTIRSATGANITWRDGSIKVSGEAAAVQSAVSVLEALKHRVSRGEVVSDSDVRQRLGEVEGQGDAGDAIEVMLTGRQIAAKSAGQKNYLKAIADHHVIFCTGPAGTGKTYLAVASAVSDLRQERIRRIVLVRPAVDAGESLGYLPGDLAAKINPYLRPLLDSLRDMIDADLLKRYNEQGVIEVAPLAYMRGRTLNDSFIILDEAQNTTIPQMKMFLTRMGHNSKIVVAGDGTQVDLPPKMKSGLHDAVQRLRDVRGITHIQLGRGDIVRHRLVQQIVQRYEATEGSRTSESDVDSFPESSGD